MARRRKGRDISGWLVVDKPAGLTSTAVVNKVRWALDAKKAGHAGTLDPDAIAETYLHVHRQHRSAWTWEVELRPWAENF